MKITETESKSIYWKGLNLTITSNTSMMTSINGKTIKFIIDVES